VAEKRVIFVRFVTELKLIFRTYSAVWVWIISLVLTLAIYAAADAGLSSFNPLRLSTLPLLLSLPVFSTPLSRSRNEVILYRLADIDMRRLLLLKNVCTIFPTLLPVFGLTALMDAIKPHYGTELHHHLAAASSIAVTALTLGNLKSLHEWTLDKTIRIRHFRMICSIVVPAYLSALFLFSFFLFIPGAWSRLGLSVGIYTTVLWKIGETDETSSTPE
jgi:hypothetical protein